ncbi:MAG: MBL fold metallo-hydrolase [Nanoarchaeota archaeon]
MKIGDIDLAWHGHDSFCIRAMEKLIYIDPYKLPNNAEKADLILITHTHYDHCSIPDIEKIAKDNTIIVIPPDGQSAITKLKKKVEIQIIEANDGREILGMRIATIPAYNIKKPFHPKEEGWLGYLIKIQNTLIYHAGDSDLTPEMKQLSKYRAVCRDFIALLPIGGTYTMNAGEAFEAVFNIKPTLAIPMHYGTIVGTIQDAQQFKQLCEKQGIRAVILERNIKVISANPH